MKKKLHLLITTLALSFAFFAVMNVSAEDESYNQVIDEADLLSDEEESDLNITINEIIDTYDFDAVILTVPSLNGAEVEAYADDYYDQNGYGVGDDRDGILFLISMEERDYYTSTCGYGIKVFTDYGIEKLNEKISPYLSDGDYYEGFAKYLSMTKEYLDAAYEGTPYDVKHPYKEPKNYLLREMIALVVSILIGLICVLSMKHKMNTARPQKYAGSYVKKNSYNLTNQKDIFMYRNVTRVKKEEKPEGGSTTHTSSSGTTHGGGGGKF